jgi:hypothetical protein
MIETVLAKKQQQNASANTHRNTQQLIKAKTGNI